MITDEDRKRGRTYDCGGGGCGYPCPECDAFYAACHGSCTASDASRICVCKSAAPMPGPTFANLGAEIGALVDEKQRAYGDSFGKSGDVLRILYPDGIRLEQLDDALAITRITDKLFRIATDRDALGESPWRDIAGYALLATRRVESAKRGGGR